MITKVLHGEGKPRIIIAGTVILTSTVSSLNNTYTVILSGSPALDDSCLNKYLKTKNSVAEATKGKIINYIADGNAVTVDFWDNLLPAVDAEATIQDEVIDLPYTQGGLAETFRIDSYPTRKRINGDLIIRLKGFYYEATLDYSKIMDKDALAQIQNLYDAGRTDPFTFYPRRDNPNVYYSCEIDPGTALTLMQLPFHQGHKGLQLKFLCIKRQTKPDFISSLLDLIGESNIVMSENFRL